MQQVAHSLSLCKRQASTSCHAKIPMREQLTKHCLLSAAILLEPTSFPQLPTACLMSVRCHSHSCPASASALPIAMPSSMCQGNREGEGAAFSSVLRCWTH